MKLILDSGSKEFVNELISILFLGMIRTFDNDCFDEDNGNAVGTFVVDVAVVGITSCANVFITDWSLFSKRGPNCNKWFIAVAVLDVEEEEDDDDGNRFWWSRIFEVSWCIWRW